MLKLQHCECVVGVFEIPLYYFFTKSFSETQHSHVFLPSIIRLRDSVTSVGALQTIENSW